MDAEELAKKFHETYESLAPSFDYETRPDSSVPWEEVPLKNRNLMVAVCRVILSGSGLREQAVTLYAEKLAAYSDSQLARDRVAWQRRLGATITAVEHWAERLLKRRGTDPGMFSGWAYWERFPEEAKALLEVVYRAANIDPSNGKISEPYADIATMATRHTIQMALATGVVVPGPDSPDWVREMAAGNGD